MDDTSRPASSRDRLVEAAIELIREHHRAPTAREVFAFLNPRSVAERAGVSRGLIYHHWGDAEADGSEAFDRFLAEVTDEMWTRVTVPEDLADMADLLPDELGSVVVALANYELDRFLSDDGGVRSILGLSLYAIGSRADLPVSVARMAKLYERVLPRLGREIRPPLTYEDFAFSAMALLDGFLLHFPAMGDVVTRRHRWGSTQTRPGEGAAELSGEGPDAEQWTLFAIAVEGIALNMTRPLPAADAEPSDEPSGGAEHEDPV